MNYKELFIKVFAYFHRYGWIVVMLICAGITKSLYIFGTFLIVFSIWTLLGYLLKWKHIFCSFQNAYHKPMTPDKINWNKIKKKDVYGISAIFFFFGIGIIIVKYFNI